MHFLTRADWGQMFIPTMSLPEVIIRGTLVYIALCILLRVVLKRQAGKVSLSDLLVVTIVAGVCRNPLVKDAYSIPDGILVVAMILLWSYAMDWLSYHVPLIHKLLHPTPVMLIRNGQLLEENLRNELMTKNQLHCKLRQQGVKDPAEVAEAWMEGDGHVSVIKQQTFGSDTLAGNRSFREQPTTKDGAATEHASGTELCEILEAVKQFQENANRHAQAVAEYQSNLASIQEVLAQDVLNRRH